MLIVADFRAYVFKKLLMQTARNTARNDRFFDPMRGQLISFEDFVAPQTI